MLFSQPFSFCVCFSLNLFPKKFSEWPRRDEVNGKALSDNVKVVSAMLTDAATSTSAVPH